MHAQLAVDLAGTPATLLAQRAVLLPQAPTAAPALLVADVHFGKDATFRARGIPVPQGSAAGDLARLSALLAATAARTLVFLGDLLHAREAQQAALQSQLAHWRGQHAGVDMLLVEGNHDRHAGAPAAAAGIRVVHEPFAWDGLALCHHPQRVAGAHVLAGHLHPCVRLTGRANDRLRLPCFWLQPGLTILPSFGEFTGGASIGRSEGDRVVAVAEDRLYELPPLPARAA